MAKRSGDSKSKYMYEHFSKVPKIEIPPKINTPNNIYEKSLSDQFFQINQKNSSENEKDIPFIEVEDDFGKSCPDEECMNEVE